MKISPITNFNYQTSKVQNLKQTETPVEQEQQQELKSLGYTDLAFKAGATKLIKPQFKTPVQQKISSKIATYLEFLPEKSKIKTPIIMNIDDKIISFSMDKTMGAGLTNVSIKMVDEDNNASMLNMTIDKKGQVKCGAYHEPNGLSTIFERSVNRMRRMQYGNAYYRAAGDNETLWYRMITHVDETISPNAAKRMEFNGTELQEILSEMAKKSTSFLVK